MYGFCTSVAAQVWLNSGLMALRSWAWVEASKPAVVRYLGLVAGGCVALASAQFDDVC